MEYTVFEKNVMSGDGIHELHGVVYKPAGEIRGIFHIVHGMTEYIERYNHVFSALASDGFLSFGFDNLGHGKTALDYSELGFIAHNNGWDYMVKDVKIFADEMRRDYPDVPYILMGHSMGSFIARLAAERYGNDISGALFCGTAGPNPAAPAGLLITDIIKLFRGEKAISPLVEKIAFGAYNKRFSNGSKYAWVCSDNKVIEKYEQDKYCTFHFTVSAMHDLVKLISECNSGRWFKSVKRDMPIFLIAGGDDPVGNYGKGVKTVYDKLVGSGHQDTELKLYKGVRHEIHNDISKDEVIKDILSFADSCALTKEKVSRI